MWANLKAIFTAAAILSLAACSQPVLQSGPDAEITDDGLVRVNHAQLAETYVRPGINLQNYNSIQLVSGDIEYRKVRNIPAQQFATPWRDEYSLTATQKAGLAAIVNEVLAEEFARSKYFTLSDQPGPGVLVANVRLTDVVSFVPPLYPRRDMVYLFELGQGTLALEVDDSVTGESFARATDRIRVQANRPNFTVLRPSNPVINRQDVRRFLRLWFGQAVVGLDELYEMGELSQP
jgi:hypothetical protein